ncbi:hypothetical protein U1839_03015 [Sphingomonas sp. RT2P30]|uniref:hypothetical protein n=1 Tax=Parasphingomonas halimpatiens TaxID=3096162 RepID=UPI002FCC8315
MQIPGARPNIWFDDKAEAIRVAVWQFELVAIPAAMAEINGVPAIRLTPEAREHIVLIMADDQRRDFVRALDDLLPRQQAWSAGLLVWGNNRGTDVQYFHDGDGSAEVHIRIDARTFRTETIEALCDIAQRFDWALVTESGTVLPPKSETVLRALLNSSARRFVEDPDSVFAQAAEQVYRPVHS